MSKYHKNCAKKDTEPPCKPSSCKRLPSSKVVSADNEERCPKHDNEYLQLLDVITNDAPCSCVITARAVRSDVHANLGLTKNSTEPKCSCDEVPSEAAGSKNPK